MKAVLDLERPMLWVALVALLFAIYLYWDALDFYVEAYKLAQTSCRQLVPITINWTGPP